MDQKQQVFRHLEDDILTITVDNPETKNGLDWAGIEQLADCYEEIDRNDAIRLGILTGNDRYFFTGGGGPLQPWGKRTLYQCTDPVSSGGGAGAQADDRGCQRPLYESRHGGAGPV